MEGKLKRHFARHNNNPMKGSKQAYQNNKTKLELSLTKKRGPQHQKFKLWLVSPAGN